MSRALFYANLDQQLKQLKKEGLYKEEHAIVSAQQHQLKLQDGREVINLCANNYLGLANHPQVRAAAQKGIEHAGYGMASVRFICGTQSYHQQLEAQLSAFLGFEDCILYSSCFDANAGLFETLLTERDAVISDALNHASIIDGIRLCKAKRYRYQNSDMSDLERCLQEATRAGVQHKMIVTDGVFSMDGIIANLSAICALAKIYDALVVVDDSHATGFMGQQGRGTHEHCNVMNQVDIITSTLGKALGGASGGFTVGSKNVISWLRQKSRPYLFSNAIPPSVVHASLCVLGLLEESHHLREQLKNNSQRAREILLDAGFTLKGREHAIIPVIIGDACKAKRFAEQLLYHGIYVVAFSYPVVPKGQARIRMQMSATHTKKELDTALKTFIRIAKDLDVI